MGLIPDFQTGIPRLLAQDTPETIILSSSQLTAFPGGLLALGGNDVVVGSPDNERIFGNLGNDTLFGGSGSDTLYGGRDDDYVLGLEGNDILRGDLGDDYIDGGEGNDGLRGGKDDDLLVGGFGNDTLIGDFGANTYKGGSGSDVYVLRTDVALTDPGRSNPTPATDVILDFNRSQDFIGLTGGLTQANLVLSPIALPIANISQQFFSTGAISLQDFDPDGNGSVTGVLVSIANSNIFLGVVLNTTVADVNGRFIPADGLLSIGA